jgi:RND family efflux transporter MFP subunit
LLLHLRMSYRLFAPALLLALSFGGCSKPEEPPARSSPVRTFTLTDAISDPFRRFPGEVSAVQTSEMSFDVPGRLIERPATQGLVVKAGTLLARLDPENYQSAVDSAASRFNNARDELSRQSQLRQRGVISAAELDRFRTEFEMAEAALRKAERDLQDTQMVAPFDGRVARTIANNFQSVRANEPILVMQNVSQLEVDIDLPEQFMSLGEQGLTAEAARESVEAQAEFPALPGQNFPLVLKSFRTVANPTARTFRVTFLLTPPAGSNILPGMTTTVLVRRKGPLAQAREESVFEVPVQAVGTWENQPVVWVLEAEKSTAQPAIVELIGPVGSSMRIRSTQLEVGAEIITTGLRQLYPGREVARLAPAAQ